MSCLWYWYNYRLYSPYIIEVQVTYEHLRFMVLPGTHWSIETMARNVTEYICLLIIYELAHLNTECGILYTNYRHIKVYGILLG